MEATWVTEPGLQETGTIQVWRQNGGGCDPLIIKAIARTCATQQGGGGGI